MEVTLRPLLLGKNMPLDLNTLDSHLVRILSEIPVSFTWKGTVYSGIISTPVSVQFLVIGGQDEQIRMDLFVRKAIFSTLPKTGDIITMSGKRYKVLGDRESPDNSQLIALQLGWARLDE